MAHGHDGHRHGGACGHGTSPAGLDRAIALGIILNTGFVVVEAAAGLWTGSLALLADAGHNAGDVVGLVLAGGANWLARRPPSARYTWGLRRTTIYAALANAVLLLAASGAILWEAWHRLQAPGAVAGPAVSVVAMGGVAINTLTALLLVRGRQDVNMRAACLHMAADAAISAGVVAAGLAIWLTGLTWIDPAVSMAITLAIVTGAWGLFRESVDLALDAVPPGVDPAAMTAALAAIRGVVEVHDLHVWAASTSETSLTVHLVVADGNDQQRVLAEAGELLRSRFEVAHATIQIEDGAAAATCRQRPAASL